MRQSQPFGLVFVLFVSCLHALLKDSTLGQYFMRFCFFIFTYMEKKSEFFFIKISVFSRPCRNWGFSYRVFRFSRIRFVKGTIFSSRFIGGVMLQALSCVFCDFGLCVSEMRLKKRGKSSWQRMTFCVLRN